MRKLFQSVAMSALGAAAMYYLDPDRGRRRRALMRDRLDWASHEAGNFLHDRSRRAAGRTRDLAASLRRPLAQASGAFRDYPLRERAHAGFDRLMSHRHALDMDRMGLAMAGMSRSSLLGRIFKAIVLGVASAAAMYYLDPDMGRRRRALVRDKLDSMSHGAGDYARRKRKMAADRLKGVTARARAPFSGLSQPRSDRQLRERIRARLGRLVSHPGAIEVVVNQGSVSLRGQVLAAEVDTLLSTVQGMSGVQHVDNRLEVHDDPGGIRAPQGGAHPAMTGGTASRPAGEAGVLH